MLRGSVAIFGLAIAAALLWPQKLQRFQQPNPPGVLYELRTATGQTRFRIGEPIPIELRFSSTLADTYGFDGSTYDRSGRMLTDWFDVQPRKGHSDPLAEFYSSGLIVGAFGGLRGHFVLNSEPITIPAYLNEWVRFDKPGRYKVQATSSRLKHQVGDAVVAVDVTSNVLALEIIEAEPGWADAQLQRPSEEIRFLGTERALRLLTRRLTLSSQHALAAMLGLVGARDSRLAARILSEEMPADEVWPRRLLAFLHMKPWLVAPVPSLRNFRHLTWFEHWRWERTRSIYGWFFERVADAVKRKYPLPEKAPYIPEPEETHTREEILADLQQPRPQLHIRFLESLPDESLPELEAQFAERAPRHPWLYGRLLARYGSARVYPPCAVPTMRAIAGGIAIPGWPFLPTSCARSQQPARSWSGKLCATRKTTAVTPGFSRRYC